jgi:Helix-turn-helix domain
MPTHWEDSIFPFEDRTDHTKFVRRIWRTRSVPEKSFISVAVPYWEIVVAREPHGVKVVARGPETIATLSAIPQNAEFLGIQFDLGVFMPTLPIPQIVDGVHVLNTESDQTLTLAGDSWEVPTYENADVFVARLVRKGILAREPLVDTFLQRGNVDVSLRSVQRRFLAATGLTFGTVRQFERAQKASELLLKGKSILDTVEMAGYSDHAHMTRSLKRFLGKVPSELRPATA